MHSIIISQKLLLADDDAVHRNVSIRYNKIKIIPPVSLLQTQIVNRPRKEGPSKNVMMLSKEGRSFEECDATKPRKNVMQLTQVLNAQNKVHI